MSLAVGSRATDVVRELLAAGETVELTIEGGSMAPFLRPGDVVTLALARPEALRPGDVVAFRAGPRLVVHRLLAIEAESLLLRGDAGPAADRIPPDALAGRVVRASRGGRRLRLGLGPERRLLAWLSRWGWLQRR